MNAVKELQHSIVILRLQDKIQCSQRSLPRAWEPIDVAVLPDRLSGPCRPLYRLIRLRQRADENDARRGKPDFLGKRGSWQQGKPRGECSADHRQKSETIFNFILVSGNCAQTTTLYEAVDAETQVAEDLLAGGVAGLSLCDMRQYLGYVGMLVFNG